MASLEESKSVLQEALKLEQAAETNCDKLLKEFQLNGYADKVVHIKNDEVEHQQMVKKLLEFLG